MNEGTGQTSKRNNVLVSASEESGVRVAVIDWINGSGHLPEGLPGGAIRYEVLEVGIPSMALSLTSGTYMTQQFILGGYEAAFRFTLVYRVQPGDSGKARLQADADLDTLAEWACAAGNLPELPGKCRPRKIKQDSRARLARAYDTGDEDHEIQLTLTYEVI